MTTPTKVAPKTRYALEDIACHCRNSRQSWDKLMAMAEKRIDPAMAIYLARLRDAIAEIERLASDAANGEYQEKEP